MVVEKACVRHIDWIFSPDCSGPLMEGLDKWLLRQFDQRFVEPNSSLVQVIKYMQNHWQELTLFLRIEGASLDKNICERTLKMAIRLLRNSPFYKLEHSAYIGDLFMTLIHTCNLVKVNPFDYLTALQKNSSALFAEPSRWLPWNYRDNFASAAV